jgi:hypothetical protein
MSEARTWNGTDLLLKGRKKEILGVRICIGAYLTAAKRSVDSSLSPDTSLSV